MPPFPLGFFACFTAGLLRLFSARTEGVWELLSREGLYDDLVVLSWELLDLEETQLCLLLVGEQLSRCGLCEDLVVTGSEFFDPDDLNSLSGLSEELQSTRGLLDERVFLCGEFLCSN